MDEEALQLLRDLVDQQQTTNELLKQLRDRSDRIEEMVSRRLKSIDGYLSDIERNTSG